MFEVLGPSACYSTVTVINSNNPDIFASECDKVIITTKFILPPLER